MHWYINLNVPMWDDTTPARDAVTRCLIACGAIVDVNDPRWDYANALTTTGWADTAPEQWIPGAGTTPSSSRGISRRESRAGSAATRPACGG